MRPPNGGPCNSSIQHSPRRKRRRAQFRCRSSLSNPASAPSAIAIAQPRCVSLVEGDGTAYTNVESEQMFDVEPGDLILTPNWTWHDHFNPGKKNIVWLDVLDSHLTRYLDASFEENYGEGRRQPVVKPDGFCRRALGTIRPRANSVNGAALPYTYKWTDTLDALKEISSAGQIDPYDGFLLEYANPVTGGPTMPTIGCWVQQLPPGAVTRPHRHTSSTIYHVVQGDGATIVGDQKGAGTGFAGRKGTAFLCRHGVGTISKIGRRRSLLSSFRSPIARCSRASGCFARSWNNASPASALKMICLFIPQGSSENSAVSLEDAL